MQNGYFQLVKTTDGFGVRLFPSCDGGNGVQISELMHYLDELGINYNLSAIKAVVMENTAQVCPLGTEQCPAVNETFVLNISNDLMSATARFIPASETGKRLSFEECIGRLRSQNVSYGIQMQALQDHFMSSGIYGTDIIVAKGKEPRHGADDKIEYYFNTNVQIRPAEREDGTVDYYNLNMINQCKQGDVLAKIIRGDNGEAGSDIQGRRIAPREVKHLTLKHGNNIKLSEDGLSVSSMVDGHVTLVEDNIFVSDVYEVENVDVSTGNINYSGSVQVNGNVSAGLAIQAGGNVIINGVVEGALITAQGNIIIARGMNGMAKGVLKAGGNVVSKFIENATVEAEGYIEAGAILHSNVSAGTEITVLGKKGFITGGHVQAGSQITVKTLGGSLGASTIVEVGVDPKIKMSYAQLQKDVVELVKSIKVKQPVIAGFIEKRAKGARLSNDQIKYVSEIAKSLDQQKTELEQKNQEMQKLRKHFELQGPARVLVQGEVYPGTTIIIGELSMVVQSKYHFCKFEVVQGDVRPVPM